MDHSKPVSVTDGLDTNSLRTDLDDVVDNPRYTAQRPYRNGVVVYKKSIWGGNGFGTDVTRVAVRDGQVVGVYESGQTFTTARVVGVLGNIGADIDWTGHGDTRRSYVTKTALNKWTEKVKSL